MEELLLASESRAQVFIFGQCVPFVLAKTRHFLVTWAGTSWLVRLAFYSLFTSHVEIGATLSCDALVAVRARRAAAAPHALRANATPRHVAFAAHSPLITGARFRRTQAHLMYDWATSASNDYSLRLNLNRLRSGYFAIASLRDTRTGKLKAGAVAGAPRHAHAD